MGSTGINRFLLVYYKLMIIMIARPMLLLLAVLYRATPVLPQRETLVSEDMLQFLGSQWHTLKMVGHLLREGLGGAKLWEIENIVEYNR